MHPSSPSLRARLLPALLAGAAVLAPADRVAAQVTTVDRGAFTITRQGAPAGREEFEIRSQPGLDGATLEARGTVTLDGRTLHPTLGVTQAGTPLSYRLEVRDGGDVVERVSGQVSPGRLRIEAQSAGGRAAREFALGERSLVLEDGVFHHYYFLARQAGSGGSVRAVVPRRSGQVTLRVTPAGTERVAVGGREVSATRLDVAESGGPARTVWVDGEGRVLRVAAQGLVAQRDEPPR